MHLRGIGRLSVCLVLLLLTACATSGATAPATVTPVPAAPARVAAAASPPPLSVPVARVENRTISTSELDAHQAATGLERSKALDDLIDLVLLREAASRNEVALPSGALTPEARAAAELALAYRFGLDVPVSGHVLVVDHAWVKDSETKKGQASQRAAIDRLRKLVAAGDTIPSGYAKLHVPGEAWHIGDHEEYSVEVVPPEARDLPAGTLSAVLAGNGGLHLFKIVEHKQVRADPDAVRSVLFPRLRQGKTVEILAR
jgi:hypothetical protein